MLEESCAGLHSWFQIRNGVDASSTPEGKNEHAVVKCIINPERVHAVIAAKFVMQLMTHEALQAACDAAQKL